MGFEPTTLTLARLCSTPELHPRAKRTGRIYKDYGLKIKSSIPLKDSRGLGAENRGLNPDLDERNRISVGAFRAVFRPRQGYHHDIGAVPHDIVRLFRQFARHEGSFLVFRFEHEVEETLIAVIFDMFYIGGKGLVGAQYEAAVQCVSECYHSVGPQ